MFRGRLPRYMIRLLHFSVTLWAWIRPKLDTPGGVEVPDGGCPLLEAFGHLEILWLREFRRLETVVAKKSVWLVTVRPGH